MRAVIQTLPEDVFLYGMKPANCAVILMTTFRNMLMALEKGHLVISGDRQLLVFLDLEEIRGGEGNIFDSFLREGNVLMAPFLSDQHITYYLHYLQCGDPSCRTCRTGPGHGPYWYAYWFKDSELYSLYIGKVDPVSLDTPMGSSAPETESTLETGSGPAREEPNPGEDASLE